LNPYNAFSTGRYTNCSRINASKIEWNEAESNSLPDEVPTLARFDLEGVFARLGANHETLWVTGCKKSWHE